MQLFFPELLAVQFVPTNDPPPYGPVKLELRDSAGKVHSDNFYWLAADGPAYRALGRLACAQVDAKAVSHRGENTLVQVTLTNRGSVVAIQTKLTLTNAADSARILPGSCITWETLGAKVFALTGKVKNVGLIVKPCRPVVPPADAFRSHFSICPSTTNH